MQFVSNSENPAAAEHSKLNQLLLDSLPHPAMVIEQSRKILAVNRTARELGACVGGHCWKDFGRSEYISEHHKALINSRGPEPWPDRIKCTFCLADEALAENKPINAPEINAFDRIWDTWWIPIDSLRYLHYAIDITDKKKTEQELRKYRDQLEKMVVERTRKLKAANEQLSLEISSRREIENALRESEERFRAMFEKNSAIKLLIDPSSGHIVNANLAASQFYGYPIENLKTMNISDISVLSPEQIAAETSRAAEEKRDHFFFKHRLASGDVRDVEVRSSRIPSGGQNLIFSIIHDITERRRAEELLKLEHNKFLSIANATENAVFIIDDHYEIHYLNPAAAQRFGPPGNRKCYEYFHGFSQACASCRAHETSAGKEFQRVWTDRRDHRTYDVFEGSLQNPDGSISQLRVLHDVTRHKQVEEALRLDEARLQALLDLSQMTRSSIDEIAIFVLKQAVQLTKSEFGSLLLMNQNETPGAVFHWSVKDGGKPVKTEEFSCFPLGDASFWEKAITQREPIIENEYSAVASCAGERSGEDAPLSRLLIAPAVAEDRVMWLRLRARMSSMSPPMPGSSLCSWMVYAN